MQGKATPLPDDRNVAIAEGRVEGVQTTITSVAVQVTEGYGRRLIARGCVAGHVANDGIGDNWCRVSRLWRREDARRRGSCGREDCNTTRPAERLETRHGM